MKTDKRLALAAMLLLAACGKQGDQATSDAAAANGSAAVTAPSGQDWTETVSETPVGGFVMGNPAAKVKLVEYASFTCPHCADFSGHATAPLQEMVRSGQVSWELRPFLLNAIDVPASLLARCQGPQPFFKLAEQLYAQQRDWIGKFQGLPPAQMQQLQSLPPGQAFAALAKAGGLDAWFRVRGVPQARVDACLSDDAALTKLENIQKVGTEQDKITGTPSFLINGVMQSDVFDWASLEPKLRAAIG